MNFQSTILTQRRALKAGWTVAPGRSCVVLHPRDPSVRVLMCLRRDADTLGVRPRSSLHCVALPRCRKME